METKLMKTTLVALLLCLVWQGTFAQSPNPWETKLQAAKTDTAKIRVCYQAADWYTKTESNYDSANFFLQKGHIINNKLGTNKQSAPLFFSFGLLAFYKKDFDKAEFYYKQVQQIALQQHDPINYQKATFSLITIDSKRGFYPSAIKQFLAFERTISNKTHQDSAVRRVLYNYLAECYYYLEEKQKYFLYIKKQLPYCQTPNDSLKVYQKKFIWSSLYNNSLDTNAYANIIRIAEKLNLPGAKITLAVNLSGHYITQKQYDKAIETAQTAIKMAGNKPEQESNKMFGYQNISEAYTGKKQYAEALQYQIKITDYLEKDISLKYISYKNLVTIYANLGNYKKAYEYSNKIAAHEEEVKGDRNKQAVAEIDAEMAAMEKQAQLAKSELNAKVQQARIETEQKQKTIVFGLLVLCLGLLAWAVWSYRKQRQLRQLLEQQNLSLATKTKELTEANQTKDKIFAVLGHDLRSPINELKTILMLFHSRDITPTKMKELIHSLTAKIEVVQEMMNNLLQWSLLELKHQGNAPQMVFANKIIEKVIHQLKASADKKQLSIETSLPAVQILAQEEDLDIIIRNLLSNAIKFTPNGGTIRIEVLEKSDFIEILCTDTGIGIPANTLETTTNAFPIQRKGTAGEVGSGLGLKITKELISKNHGKLLVHSENNQGTAVSIYFSKSSNYQNEKSML